MKKKKQQSHPLRTELYVKKYADHCRAYLSGGIVPDENWNPCEADTDFLEEIEAGVEADLSAQFMSTRDRDNWRKSIARMDDPNVAPTLLPSVDLLSRLRRAIIQYLQERPDLLKIEPDKPKYRRINDPWEPLGNVNAS